MLKPIPIEKIPAPGKKEFYRKYVSGNRPVVINGVMDKWAALKIWNFQYFIKNFGNTETTTGRVKDGKGYVSINEGIVFKNSTFKEALPIVEEGNIEESRTVITAVSALPSTVLNDYTPPEYCSDGRFLTSFMFLGAKGLVTPLHQDLQENLYAVIKGKKKITLFAPGAPVYPYSRFSKLPNFSQIDVGNPDYQQFPNLVHAQPYSVELEAGEILYIPSFWWHYISNAEPSIAMNFWWAVGWRIPIVWAGLLYGKIRNLGNHSISNK